MADAAADGSLVRADDTDTVLGRFRDALRERHGTGVAAIVLYGSYVRGQRDTVLDFYVLLDGYPGALPGLLERAANRALPPNVYHVTLEADGRRLAAKYATVTLAQFERGIRRAFHSYFWARFAQPFTLVYVREEAVATTLATLQLIAARRMVVSSAPLIDGPFDADTLWSRAFTLSYGCELRSEDASRAAALVRSYGTALASLTERVAAEADLAAADGPGRWTCTQPPRMRRARTWQWRARRVQGKVLSVLRLFKAAFTFNDPLDYVLWKIERHSGVRAEPTALQRRHPLIFAWPLLWRVYRRGGFR